MASFGGKLNFLRHEKSSQFVAHKNDAKLHHYLEPFVNKSIFTPHKIIRESSCDANLHQFVSKALTG